MPTIVEFSSRQTKVRPGGGIAPKELAPKPVGEDDLCDPCQESPLLGKGPSIRWIERAEDGTAMASPPCLDIRVAIPPVRSWPR